MMMMMMNDDDDDDDDGCGDVGGVSSDSAPDVPFRTHAP